MLIHLANVIILASFLVGDVMWLRSLSIIGGGVWVCYFSTEFTEVNWSGIGWNVLFTLINVWYIIQLILERRPISLTERERELKHLIAPDLELREWSKLLQAGEVVSGEAVLVTEGSSLDSVYLMMSGAGQRTRNGVSEELSVGQLIGALPYLTEGLSPEHVESLPGAQLIRWSNNALKVYLNGAPESRAVFQRLLGAEVSTNRG